jgi:hypothetical protein
MKSKVKLPVIILSFLSILFFAHCNSLVDSTDQPQNNSYSGNSELSSSLNKMSYENISPLEKDGLVWMREEEKLARDVYSVLLSKWGSNVFGNIVISEQRHMDAVKMLLDKYKIPDPVVNNSTGYFTNEKIKLLYSQLVTTGNISLINAFKVGATIEELDILDLKKQLNEVVDNQDFTMVYNNLLQGSYSHLKAFVRNLAAQGITYVPQYLDQSTYNSIINN